MMRGARETTTTRFRLWVGAAALVVSSFTSGCGSDEPDVRQYRDIGQVCLESDDGQRLSFRVFTSDQCLSACDENVFSCSATLVGTRIELRTLLETSRIPGVEVCPASCESAAGRCLLDVPSPGNYQFGFGSSFDTATLPREGRIALFGEHRCEPEDSTLPNPFR
jgi:hypothetical protein